MCKPELINLYIVLGIFRMQLVGYRRMRISLQLLFETFLLIVLQIRMLQVLGTASNESKDIK